ncbi:MAG TPA: 4-(cytidine 5'-diphospho)-2-C-methyl-D-erythritol kinase [Vicinamibacterales bacterium]|nr:4-(cytidine 5'-diphospho)-2-C-methyl-D-erythritol kinase [Vicinamibacterales bacterium]
MRSVTLPSFAKINLDLRVLGTRPDGYHDLKTVFQSLALFDGVTVTARRGPLTVTCDEPDIPTDQRNLVWKAASLLHRVATGKSSAPRDIAIDLRKRIPSEAGLGGGSSNAAMTLLALNKLWKLELDAPSLSRIGARLGADVPYFLVGGTALGLGRGDDIYPLADMPPVHVVILRPGFGVSTADAYTWFDEESRRSAKEPAPRALPPGWPAWSARLRNDLEMPVVRHHPAIGRIRQSLLDAGAAFAAMSGSGSAVFGLFERGDAARRTANDLARPGWLSLHTRTLSRREYDRRVARSL